MPFRFQRSALAAALATALLAHATAATAQVAPQPAANSAAEPAPMRAIKLAAGEKIAMDGTLSSPAWQRAPVFNQFVENQPNPGAKSRFETRVQVVYDEQALYFGITALDPKPEALRAVPVRHDQVFRTQDFVVVYVDAIGLKKSTQFFRANALGVTGDGLYTADNDNEDFSPDYDHDVAAQRNAQGYTAVIRIPYSALRFDPASTRPWRVMVGRRIPREQVVLDLSVPLTRQDPNFIAKLQVLEGFEPPKAQAFWQLRPTITARSTREDDGFATTTENKLKLSLDAKVQPNAQWVLDATVNPDFSQVALDVPQLSRNNRFALFQQEKRPVFLESRDLINTSTDSIYTRAIHDPRWVGRASYRSADASGTAIATSDKGGGLVLIPGAYGNGASLSPANRTLLTRWKLDAAGHTYGLVASSRQYDGAGSNTHLGVDWQQDLPEFGLGTGWRTQGQLATSDTSALQKASGKLAEQSSQRGQRLWAKLDRRGEGWEANVAVDRISSAYRNDAGFVSQNGILEFNGEYKRKYSQVTLGGSKFQDIHAYVVGKHVRDATGGPNQGDTIQAYITPGLWFQGDRSEFSAELRAISLTRSGPAAPLMHEKYLHFWGNTQFSAQFPLVEGYADIGQLADYASDRTRQAVRWGAFARTRLHERLELEPKIDQLRFASGPTGGALTETAARVLGIYHLQARHSLRLILQASHYRREADAKAGLTADSGRSGAQSLTYIWRHNNAQALYVGAQRGSAGALGARKTQGSEAFVKYQFEV